MKTKKWLIFAVASLLVGATWLTTSPQSVTAATKHPKTTKKVTMNFVGDGMFTRGVKNAANAHGGFNYNFARVKKLWRGDDFTFMNLETPIIKSAKKTPSTKPKNDISFYSTPSSLKAVKKAGINAVSIANNHGLDHGRKGFKETMQQLKQRKIAYTGGGKNVAQAKRSIVYKKINGVKIAVVAINDVIPPNFTATKTGAGQLTTQVTAYKQTIKKAHSHAQYVVVVPHWGEEYKQYPTKREQQLAHQFIDAGADLIIGGHPHVLQPIKKYHGGVIFYSVGNFIFDQIGLVRNDSVNVQVKLNGKTKRASFTVTPLRIVKAQPRPATGKAAQQRIFKTLKNKSTLHFKQKKGTLQFNVKY